MSKSSSSSQLLLDAYPGAVGAYSLRKLRSAYTGYAIRVVRSTDQAVLDVGFDVNGNLDITPINTFIGGNFGSISIWYDQSGNGNNATQNTFGNQPYITFAGTLNTLNSKPIIRTNGTNVSRFFNTPISNIQNRPVSMITASKIYNLASNAYGNTSWYIGGSVNSGGGSRYEMLSTSSKIQSGIRGTSTYLDNANYSTNPFIHQAHFGSTILTGRFNGADTSMTINDTGQFTTASNFVLLAAPSTTAEFAANMGMYETIFYLSDKTADRVGIESNINTYYSIY
jgi:hypothetical protein